MFSDIWSWPQAQVIDSKRTYLRLPVMEDYEDWAALRLASRQFLEPWEPTWASDALSRESFKRRLRYYAKGYKADELYAFSIYRRVDDQLVGGITLSNVRRGVTQSGSLGYWMGASFANQGLMSDALSAFCLYAVKDLRLHRLDAACIPDNHASARVLEKCGFTEEGFARQYRRIDGRWQDHRLFGLIESDLHLGPGGL